MSVVIAHVSDFISLIATDTRISYGIPAGEPPEYSDDNEKLFQVNNLGWAAGAGVCELLDNLKTSISATEITEVSQIMSVFQKEYSSLFEIWPFEKSYVKMTGLCVSWLGFDADLNRFVFRIGILSEDSITNNSMGRVKEDEFYLLFPTDYIEDSLKRMDFLNKFKPDFKFNGDLLGLFLRVFQMFKEISDNSDSVSNYCDLGIHIATQTSLGRIRLGGNIDDLLHELNMNTIFNRMVFV